MLEPRWSVTAKTPEGDALALLGLAHRAGAVAVGTEACRRALREGAACLVLLASDAAEGQIGKVRNLARHRGVRQREVADRRRLGAAVGRPPTTAVAVTERSFAQELLLRLSSREGDAEQAMEGR